MKNLSTLARIAAPLVAATLLISCGGGRPNAQTAAVESELYTQYIVKSVQKSAAFIDVHDFDGDDIQEIVLSTLIEDGPPGPPSGASRGALRIFKSTTTIKSEVLSSDWTEILVIDFNSANDEDGGFPFINTPQVFDVDDDGTSDIIVQTGFLTTGGGAHFWQKCSKGNPLDCSSRNYFSQSNTRKETSASFYWHESGQADLDRDGLPDIVTTSTNSTGNSEDAQDFKVEWYRQSAAGTFEYRVIAESLSNPGSIVGGVFIKLFDVDKDGDQDIVLSQFFGPPSVPSIIWLENRVEPTSAPLDSGTWVQHSIDNTIGLGYHMEFVDIDGDGDDELVAGNHNNEADPRSQDEDGNLIRPPGIFIFEIPIDPTTVTQWEKRTISDAFRVTLYFSNPGSQGVPGIFNVGDINNDGLPDVAVPGDGNDKLYGMIQSSGGSWTQEIIATAKQFGMAIVADIDGDGSNEIVAAQHNSLDAPPGPDTLEFPDGMIAIYKRN